MILVPSPDADSYKAVYFYTPYFSPYFYLEYKRKSAFRQTETSMENSPVLF
jgi:hypothetical protein